MAQVTAVLVGAGNRGSKYASYAKAFPEKLKLVAIAELRDSVRKRVQEEYSIPSDKSFPCWKQLVELGKIADCVIITTNDTMHVEPALAFAKLQYKILLEKPMATTLQNCLLIERTCAQNKVFLAICHVLRYLPSVLAIKNAINNGLLGDIVNIEHTENIGFWHFAHSFVRGNWRSSKQSSFSLLTKCCHDVDLIRYWMGGKICTHVSSFGSLFYFRKDKAPVGSGTRCMVDCDIEDICPYSVKKIYLDSYKGGEAHWPHNVVCETGDNFKTRLTEALCTGPYGRCVYQCDNDVCDNQVVQFQYKDGATATLTMIAFTEEICIRKTKITGTKGELSWDGDNQVLLYDFLSRKKTQLPLELNDKASAIHNLSGHGGADFYLMNSFVQAVASGSEEGMLTNPRDSLESHMLVFAAEHSRLTGNVVDYQQFRSEALTAI